MIRKTKRKKPKTNDKLFESYRWQWLWDKFIKVDSFVPEWPWEMKYYGFTGIIRHYVQKMLVA